MKTYELTTYIWDADIQQYLHLTHTFATRELAYDYFMEHYNCRMLQQGKAVLAFPWANPRLIIEEVG